MGLGLGLGLGYGYGLGLGLGSGLGSNPLGLQLGGAQLDPHQLGLVRCGAGVRVRVKGEIEGEG